MNQPARPATVDRARRRLALGATLGVAAAAWPAASRARGEPVRRRASRPMMGTSVDIAVQGEDPQQLDAAIAAAYRRMATLVGMMSHYQPASRVAAIGLAAGLQPVAIEPELMDVLAMARRLSQRSGGAFDVTIGSVGRWHFDANEPRMPAPGYIAAHLADVDWRHLVLDRAAGTAFLQRRGMRIDPGGIAKLPILAAGLQTLRQHGVDQALVNGGGDVVAAGGASQRPWRVGIRDPRRPGQLLGALDVRDGFVASSGDYERFFVRDGRRYHHVLDPKTGYPARGPRGVILVGRDLEAVNGLGAAAMVLGAGAGRDLIRSTPGVQALVAGRDDALWIMPGLRERLLPA